MSAVWGMGQMMFTKFVVVVDEHVDVHDSSEVAWRVFNNVDPRRDTMIVDGPLDVLDHSSPTAGYGAKMGIDATKAWPDEGHRRDWPDELAMDPAVVRRVDGALVRARAALRLRRGALRAPRPLLHLGALHRRSHRRQAVLHGNIHRHLLVLSLVNWAIAIACWAGCAYLGIARAANLLTYTVLFVVGLFAAVVALVCYVLARFGREPAAAADVASAHTPRCRRGGRDRRLTPACGRVARRRGGRRQPALFARLVKVEHSVYALPFAYAGAVLAEQRMPCWRSSSGSPSPWWRRAAPPWP